MCDDMASKPSSSWSPLCPDVYTVANMAPFQLFWDVLLQENAQLPLFYPKQQFTVYSLLVEKFDVYLFSLAIKFGFMRCIYLFFTFYTMSQLFSEIGSWLSSASFPVKNFILTIQQETCVWISQFVDGNASVVSKITLRCIQEGQLWQGPSTDYFHAINIIKDPKLERNQRLESREKLSAEQLTEYIYFYLDFTYWVSFTSGKDLARTCDLKKFTISQMVLPSQSIIANKIHPPHKVVPLNLKYLFTQLAMYFFLCFSNYFDNFKWNFKYFQNVFLLIHSQIFIYLLLQGDTLLLPLDLSY